MAKVFNLDSLEAPRQIMVLVKENIEEKRREIAFTVLRNLKTISPVNTGRLREGFVPTLNTPSSYVPAEGKYGSSFTVEATEWNKATESDVYYITNNVPYAVMVNNGTVKMAPRRFVERALTIVNKVL